MQPTDALPFLTRDTPGFGGVWKETCEDFAVEEIPLYLPAGAGDHLYLQIEKNGIATLDAVRELAAHLKASSHHFGYAGMKDAKSVSRQWVSIEHRQPLDVKTFRSDKVRVLQAVMHGNKLRIGHLNGNRFCIVLRGIDASAEGLSGVETLLQRLQREGCPNYYTEQRFGRDGKNADCGRALLSLLHERPADIEEADRKWLLRQPRKTKQIWLSALQSLLFNDVLARRVLDGSMNTLLDGDLAYLHRNGAVFSVAEAAVEQSRCAAFEISPSGPIPGYKMIRPAGKPAELEEAVYVARELQPADFDCGKGLSQKGERRPLRFLVDDPQVEIAAPDALRLSFSLPKGCYATAVLREVCKHGH